MARGGLDRSLSGHPDDDQLSDIGVRDAKFQVQPGLVLDVTVNTDFSKTKIDTAQVNLARFSLFFPEQRELDP